MQFPSMTETFASTDVKALLKMGIQVSVYSMKWSHKHSKAMVEERGLSNIPKYNSGVFELLVGLWVVACNVNFFISTVLWTFRCESFINKEFIKCLALIPSAFYICSKLKKNPPDIVHLFWGHYPSLVAYLLPKFNINAKVSIFLGAYDLILKLGVSKYIANRADLIFTHSQSNIDSLVDFGVDKSKIKMIYRGVDVNLYGKYTGYKKINGRILTAGKLCTEKRFDLVIDVLKKGLEQGHNLTLEIVGSGPERYNLEKKVKQLSLTHNVFFAGHISQESLFEKMAYSQFFVFLSDKVSERLPNVLKEAMYYNCTCISSESIGISELIDHNKNGFIFSKNDYKYIHKCFDLGEYKLQSIGQEAHNKIVKKFNVDSSMKKYITCWKDVLND